MTFPYPGAWIFEFSSSLWNGSIKCVLTIVLHPGILTSDGPIHLGVYCETSEELAAILFMVIVYGGRSKRPGENSVDSASD